MRSLKKIRVDFYLFLLIFIAVFLCYQNYTPNTILSGWDTLHPEFNLKQYIGRITSVWQEHQGLGAPPSQAHAAELPRMLIITILQIIFSKDFVRYGYFFLMIILGPVGVYFLLKYLLENSRPSAFLGALIYLLNVGTMQNFIAPFEMFATKFGFLGFLYLFALKFVQQGNKKYLWFFSLVTVLASPMAHTATLWYIYFIGLVLFFASYSFFYKNLFKRSLMIIAITFLINLYWILPNLYYSINYSADVINSKINRLSTQETYLYNKKYGNLSDFLLFKNFLFDWQIINNDGRSADLLASWTQHLSNPFVLFLGYLFSLTSIIGLIVSLVKKKYIFVGFGVIALSSSFFLLSGTPLISPLSDQLINHNLFFREVFRSPFTKFSLYLIFTLAIFFGYAQKIIFEKIKKSPWYFYILVLLILFYSQPAIQGNFISPTMRVSLPQEYFSLFQWSKKHEKGRILTLPLHNLFGWVYYQWGQPAESQIYQGAGFNWFGLSQPSLNREFDRWYPYNEQSFREFSYALYSKNYQLFEKLLNKYQIEYILIDQNVFNPGGEIQQKKLFYQEIQKLLVKTENIKLTQRFGEKIRLYHFLPTQGQKPIELITDYKVVIPKYGWNYIDQAYFDNGNYISPDNQTELSNKSLFYPARNILTEKEKINPAVINIDNQSYKINFNLDKSQSALVKIPKISETENIFYADIFAQPDKNNIKIIIKSLLPYVEQEDIYNKEIVLLNSEQQFSINGELFILPEFFTDQSVFLGEATLFVNQENILKLYHNQQSSIQLLTVDINELEIMPNLLLIKGKFPQEQINFDLKKLANETRDCGFKKAKAIKKEVSEMNGSTTIEYHAQDGSLCDVLFFSELSQNVGYLLAIESQNLSGLPLKICFENDQTKMCSLEDTLSKNNSFNTDYFIIPPYSSGLGYNLIVNNLSIGNIPSINRLKKIQLIPFPFRFFQAVRWQPNNQLSKTTNISDSPVTDGLNTSIDVTQFSPSLYTANLNQDFPDKSILFLNQAYEKNWQAFKGIPDLIAKNPLLIYLSPLFGQKINDHVLVNNWANGWTLRPSTALGTTESQVGSIVIIFWPQYLEFFGFLVLILTFLFIFRLPNQSPHDPALPVGRRVGDG